MAFRYTVKINLLNVILLGINYIEVSTDLKLEGTITFTTATKLSTGQKTTIQNNPLIVSLTEEAI